VPEGGLALVAQFPPPAAMGRIREGQTALLRLEGFPWMQYGAVPAVVSRVSNETRDGTVRVEFEVKQESKSAIPMQHGLPGTVEVEVERITPIELILRKAGRLVTESRSAF
jgi:membrane fusion protein (multidrug efflux system)